MKGNNDLMKVKTTMTNTKNKNNHLQVTWLPQNAIYSQDVNKPCQPDISHSQHST